jgi:hypothetical protein
MRPTVSESLESFYYATILTGAVIEEERKLRHSPSQRLRLSAVPPIG